MSIIGLQRRQRELGRIRLGDRGVKGQPQKLSEFRLTSSARHLLEYASQLWGGEVREWAGAPSAGQYELYTRTSVLPIVVPPGAEATSWYETWSGGGCLKRCDGVRNHIDDSPCSCNQDERECKPTTRINVMLPDLPDVGVWRLETHGINAAYELPGTIEIIQMASRSGEFLTGRLRIEHRTSKSGGQTRKFIVPVIDLDVSVKSLMSGAPSVALESGAATAALEAGAAPAEVVESGESPPRSSSDSHLISDAQKRRMFAVAKECDVSTEALKEIIQRLTGQDSSAGIPRDKYDSIISEMQADALFADTARKEDVA